MRIKIIYIFGDFSLQKKYYFNVVFISNFPLFKLQTIFTITIHSNFVKVLYKTDAN